MQGYLDLPEFSKIDLGKVEQQLDELLANADKKIAALEKVVDPSWDNFLFELDQTIDEIQRFYSPIRHMNAVVSSDEIREVHNACLPKLTAWYTEFGQNRALYEHTRTIAASDAFKSYDQGLRKSIEDQLLSFTLGGVALEGKERDRYKEIASELSQLSTKFNENVLDSGNDFRLNFSDEKALDGFPQNSLDLARQNAEQEGEQGYSLSLDFPNYYAVMTFANDRDLRRQMYSAWNTRATGVRDEKWDNAPVIENTVRLRAEKAKLLGFDNYADYSIANKMVDSPQQVIDFLNDLGKRAKPSAEKDYAELEAFATGEAEIKVKSLEPWDVSYYSNQLKKKLYDFSEQDLKPYFPASIGIPGLFEVTGKLFGIDITEVKDADVWHEDVSLYKISDKSSGELRGAFYMDNYARNGKRAGAWMDVCVGRMKKKDGIQLPVAYLTCNLTPPVGDKPALLTHGELTTLFHEFGHGLHHMLTRVEYASVAGISGVEWDAVELPSQFLENWCWERESIDLVSGHFESGEKLPQELLDKARAAKNFQSGLGTVRQLEFSLFDMHMHLRTDALDANAIQQLLDSVRAEVAVYKIPAEVKFQNAFSHVFAGGYAAGYFSYKWAEVLSADAYEKFEEDGIFNEETGRHFMQSILEKGGTQKALELFVAFRGREPKIDALLRHTGLAA